MSTIEYIIDNSPKAQDNKVIRDGIASFNNQVIKDKSKQFSIFAKDKNKIAGGAIIWQHIDALYIDVLWFDENYRKKGLGTKIMSMIEGVAIDNRLPKIFVDTYAFQAQEFYEKHGFYCIGSIPEHLMGYDRIFMKKDIS